MFLLLPSSRRWLLLPKQGPLPECIFTSSALIRRKRRPACLLSAGSLTSFSLLISLKGRKKSQRYCSSLDCVALGPAFSRHYGARAAKNRRLKGFLELSLSLFSQRERERGVLFYDMSLDWPLPALALGMGHAAKLAVVGPSGDFTPVRRRRKSERKRDCSRIEMSVNTFYSVPAWLISGH